MDGWIFARFLRFVTHLQPKLVFQDGVLMAQRGGRYVRDAMQAVGGSVAFLYHLRIYLHFSPNTCYGDVQDRFRYGSC